jgi:putative transposase
VVGSATAQQIERKNSEAWRSFFTLLQLKKQGLLPSHIRCVNPPSYWKDRRSNARKLIILIRCDSYRFDNHVLRLPKKLCITWKGKPKWVKWTRQGRLIIKYDEITGKWYARQPVEVEPPHQPLSNLRAYVDVGVINLLTIAVEDERNTIAYSGRPALADWWYLSYRINRLKSLARTINNQDTTREVRRLFRRRRLRLRQYFNTTVRRAIKDMWTRGVSILVVGDLTGILVNGASGRKANTLTHNFWSHRHLLRRISEVAEEYGMEVELVDERGTSSTCTRCGSRRVSHHGRLFKCLDCKLEAHRDTVGAVNIGVIFGGRVNGVMAHPVEVCV